MNNAEYNNMQQILKQTDYVALKLAEGANPLEYAEVLALRQRCRDKINEWNGEEFIAPTFEDLRVRKYREISQAHKEYVAGSVMTSLGFPMQFGIQDSLMVEGAIKLAQESGAETIYLTDAEDATHYDISLADAQTVLLEMSTAFAQAHAKKQTLRERTAKAQTQSDLDKISW